tara:strand:+ start:528 stop:713 length:186 start_codon:yes stop_codon:yes gene_type:complete
MVNPVFLETFSNVIRIDPPLSAMRNKRPSGFRFASPKQASARELQLRWVLKLQYHHIVLLL